MDLNKKNKKKSFKYYYDHNPEFRERHLEKLKEKQKCSCGTMVSRVNLKRHKESEKHKKRIERQLIECDDIRFVNIKPLIDLKEKLEKMIHTFKIYNKEMQKIKFNKFEIALENKKKDDEDEDEEYDEDDD